MLVLNKIKHRVPIYHAGYFYPTLNALARAHGTHAATVLNRLERGLPLDRALTVPSTKQVRRIRRLDTPPTRIGTIDGVPYTTKSELARAFGISRQLLDGRLRLNWTLRQAVGLDDPPERTPRPTHHRTKHAVTLHGVTYPNRTALTRAFGISGTWLTNRLKRIPDLETALLGENAAWTDFVVGGRRYAHIGELARAYDVRASTLYRIADHHGSLTGLLRTMATMTPIQKGDDSL